MDFVVGFCPNKYFAALEFERDHPEMYKEQFQDIDYERK